MPYNQFGMWVPEDKFIHDYGFQGKRNLSASTTSPEPVDKKPKSFVSPNRYTVLRVDHDSSENVFSPPSLITIACEYQSQTDNINNAICARPINIKNVTNFSLFKNKLIQLTCINCFTCKAMSSYLIVRPKIPNNAKIIHQF